MPRRGNRAGRTFGSDAEAFAAAAFAGDVRVAEAERLVQPFFDEIDLRAVDEPEALLVHHDLDPAVFENDVFGLDLVGVIDDVGEAVAAGLAHSHAQPQPLATRPEILADPFCRRFSQCNRHLDRWSVFPLIRSRVPFSPVARQARATRPRAAGSGPFSRPAPRALPSAPAFRTLAAPPPGGPHMFHMRPRPPRSSAGSRSSGTGAP